MTPGTTQEQLRPLGMGQQGRQHTTIETMFGMIGPGEGDLTWAIGEVVRPNLASKAHPMDLNKLLSMVLDQLPKKGQE